MNWTRVVWDCTAGGNVEHVEEHDLTADDVDYVLENPESTGVSRSSGRPCVFGRIPTAATLWSFTKRPMTRRSSP